MKDGKRWIIGTIIITIAILGLSALITLWNAMLTWPVMLLAAWALLVTALLVPLFGAGYYFGHTEARGVLHGFDQGVDKVAHVIGQVATQRDTARAARATAPGLGPYTMVLPGVRELPPITHRGGGDTRETIEL